MRVAIADLEAAEGCDAKLEAALRELVEHSRREPGTLAYGIHRAGNNWCVVEVYRDQAALEAHLGSPELKAFMATAPVLLRSEPVLRIFDSIDGFGFGESC